MAGGYRGRQTSATRSKQPGIRMHSRKGRHRVGAATLRRVQAYNPAMDEKEGRIVEARLKLRERFLNRMKQTPGASDSRPLGHGPTNRHGMPKVPEGQTITTGWPVLDLGRQPNVPLSKWELVVDGAVEDPVRLSWKDLLALPQVKDTSDFHCVTTWSKMDVEWEGVQLATVIALARPKPEATHLMTHAYDGYTTNLPLEEDRKSTRLNSSHLVISYAVFCLKKKKKH